MFAEAIFYYGHVKKKLNYTIRVLQQMGKG